VSVAYGALYYGFAVLITEPAAGGEFSRTLLSLAYGGAVISGGAVAIPVGRIADRRGVRALMACGCVLVAGGLVLFSLAQAAWQVLAAWWLVLGPATALAFYEPAYVAIQQAFAPERRARAIGTLTLAAGLSGPVFTPATGALVDELGWRAATRVLAVVALCVVPAALAWLRTQPAPAARERRRLDLAPFRRARLLLFTVGAVLAYGAVEAIVIHRVARFQELGFALSTVALWAGISGLLTLPGRFLLPLLARRVRATFLLAGVIGVIAVSAALMVTGDSYAQMVVSFALFGVVFGAALPLRAIVMGVWTATEVFGAVMGVLAAFIALGRATVPTVTGALHDLADGYAGAMAMLTVMLAAAAVLVIASQAAPGQK
jgi:MFS family permease